ncbi:MAG: polyprenol monophosphomannose synthase [Desulfobacterales bacterium]|nr:MAG: polyprenol monophosphomannose synthase [Desulfobacterales bacterium]
MKMNSDPTLSVITPTLREAANIPFFAKEISSALDPVIPRWELIIVDDNSQDGTVETCGRLQHKGLPIRLMVRKDKQGLATAVLDGFKMARAKILVVMDADLSHRGEDILKLYEAICTGAEFAIGSRYITGGSTDDKWTVYRFINSKIASLLARPLVDVSDPMSGFFAVSRPLLRKSESLSPVGYKIGLEIIVKCKPHPIKEVPIHFRTRVRGKSKLTLKQQLLYIFHLYNLYRFEGVTSEKWKW